MYPTLRLFLIVLLMAVLALPLAGVAAAEDLEAASGPSNSDSLAPGGQKSIEEIAREMANPLAAFYRFEYESQYRTYRGDIAGADDQNSWEHYFQITLPFREKNGKGWVFRFALPYFADQPIYSADRGYAEWRIRQQDPTTQEGGYWYPTHGHTDATSFDLVYGGVNDSGRILNYGMAGELPTTSDTSNGRQQLILGPKLNIGKMTDWGVYGAVISHVIDVAEKKEKNPPDMNQTTIQAYLSYGLGNGWQLISNPIITYDWKGDGGNKLNLPLGGGVAKTTSIGKMPLRIAAEIQYYVASTDRFGPDMLFKFSLSPIMPGKHTRH